MSDLVYKIMSEPEWNFALESGAYAGSAADLRDGFIHLSSPRQVTGTWERHFRGQPELLLISFEASQLGPDLRWETSRDGEDFPHLYSPLLTRLALKVERIDPVIGPEISDG